MNDTIIEIAEIDEKLRTKMWKSTIRFLQQLYSKEIADVKWEYQDDGAVTKIEITFDHPIYMKEIDE